MAELYEPIDKYKPIAEGIGIVDGPFEYFRVAGIRMPIPFTTRMTVVRLKSGDLFLHSPISYEAELAAELERMGRVRHLISPNQWHYAHIGEWQRAYPDAVAWASPGVRRRARARRIDVRFTRELSETPPPEWSGEIDQTVVPGGIFREFVFFHKASRTLILADTIMNLEAGKVDQPWRAMSKLLGATSSGVRIFFGMRLPLFLQRRKARAAFAKIRSWGAERIVLSHGRCFDEGAGEVVDALFGD